MRRTAWHLFTSPDHQTLPFDLQMPRPSIAKVPCTRNGRVAKFQCTKCGGWAVTRNANHLQACGPDARFVHVSHAPQGSGASTPSSASAGSASPPVMPVGAAAGQPDPAALPVVALAGAPALQVSPQSDSDSENDGDSLWKDPQLYARVDELVPMGALSRKHQAGLMWSQLLWQAGVSKQQWQLIQRMNDRVPVDLCPRSHNTLKSIVNAVIPASALHWHYHIMLSEDGKFHDEDTITASRTAPTWPTPSTPVVWQEQVSAPFMPVLQALQLLHDKCARAGILTVDRPLDASNPIISDAMNADRTLRCQEELRSALGPHNASVQVTPVQVFMDGTGVGGHSAEVLYVRLVNVERQWFRTDINVAFLSWLPSTDSLCLEYDVHGGSQRKVLTKDQATEVGYRIKQRLLRMLLRPIVEPLSAQRLRAQQCPATGAALDALRGRTTLFYLHSCAADLLAAASLLGLKAGYCGNCKIPLELLNKPNHHVNRLLQDDVYCSMDIVTGAVTEPQAEHDDGTACQCSIDDDDDFPIRSDLRCRRGMYHRYEGAPPPFWVDERQRQAGIVEIGLHTVSMDWLHLFNLGLMRRWLTRVAELEGTTSCAQVFERIKAGSIAQQSAYGSVRALCAPKQFTAKECDKLVGDQSWSAFVHVLAALSQREAATVWKSTTKHAALVTFGNLLLLLYLLVRLTWRLEISASRELNVPGNGRAVWVGQPAATGRVRRVGSTLRGGAGDQQEFEAALVDPLD